MKGVCRAALYFLWILVVWMLVNRMEIFSGLFLPSPESVGESLGHLILHEELWFDALTSLRRVGEGFVISMGVGVFIGLLCSAVSSLKSLVDATIGFLRYVPAAALIPLSVLWFGIGESGKIFLIFMGMLPYVTFYVGAAASGVEKEYLEMASVFGADRWKLQTKIILPRILPIIWDIGRIEMGGAWALVILAELVASNSGLGYRLVLAQRFLRTSDIFALVLVIGMIGLMIDLVFRVSRRRLFPWAKSQEERLA